MSQSSSEPITHIAAAKGVTPLKLSELWAYRELTFFFLWRDLKSRYKQTVLGPIWMLLQPILNTVIYTLLLSFVADLDSGGIPHALLTYSSLLFWMFFSKCLLSTSGSLRSYKNLISKIYFPRLIVPVVAVLSALVDLVISFMLLIVLMIFVFDYPPTINILYIPLYALCVALMGVAVGLWLAPWIVHFWDIQNITSFMVRGWMYLTPVIYHIDVIKEKFPAFFTYYQWNPMVTIMEGYRWSLLGEGRPPDSRLFFTMVVVVLFLIAGAFIYRRAERTIVDIA